MLKYLMYIVLLIVLPTASFAQENINDLFAAGVEDAKTFVTGYIAPAEEGVEFSINNGWFNNAKSLHKLGFTISLVGNTTFIKDEKKSFVMNISDYENVRFPDNSASKNVATALGQNNPPQTVIVTYDDPIFGEEEVEIELPNGIGSKNFNIIPSAFLQASFALFKGTEIKARYFPRVEFDDNNIGLYGFGLQHEFTSWLAADNAIPVAISGVVAYTHLDGSYEFTDMSVVEGEDQKIETDLNTMLFQLIVGTKLPLVNFYGGIGYITGTSETDLLGSYIVSDGLLFSEQITDPFSIKRSISGLRATIGANLKLGFFGINADYNIAEFNSASIGINFGI